MVNLARHLVAFKRYARADLMRGGWPSRSDDTHCPFFTRTRKGHATSPSVDGQLLINALTGQVGTDTKMSGYPTNQELPRLFAAAMIIRRLDDLE